MTAFFGSSPTNNLVVDPHGYLVSNKWRDQTLTYGSLKCPIKISILLGYRRYHLRYTWSYIHTIFCNHQLVQTNKSQSSNDITCHCEVCMAWWYHWMAWCVSQAGIVAHVCHGHTNYSQNSSHFIHAVMCRKLKQQPHQIRCKHC